MFDKLASLKLYLLLDFSQNLKQKVGFNLKAQLAQF